ncbi:carbonic anhydrase-like [Engystomops pustulosus]|uniref:carbonic anhydrase-like n=1 Tax=Engystomops pustulosus TaxID=76066 RepID=UPI003AFAEEE7
MLRLVCVGVLYLVLGCQASGEWCYEHDECGPEEWEEHYPSCGLDAQSPINIITSRVQENRNLGPIYISGNSGIITGVVTNSGHTVEVTVSSVYQLRNAALPNVYQLAAFHLHFGELPFDDEGSEHHIDGNAFPLEIHFVFYNTKYPDLLSARDNPDGLAVVGVLFNIGDHNEILQNLISVLPNVAYRGDKATVYFNLENLIPAKLSNYYKYRGSLTTPPCSESVAWHVISSPLEISFSQYRTIVSSLYSTTRDEEENPMINNFRPTQPLNGRIVYKYQN